MAATSDRKISRLERAIAALEAARGFAAVDEADKVLVTAAAFLGAIQGPEADALWKRVGAARAGAREALVRAHMGCPARLNGGNGHGDPGRARREAARRARQLARSGPKGGPVAAKSGDGGKKKKKGKAR